MSEGYKQAIDPEMAKELEDVLTRFCDKHQPGNPGILQAVQEVEGKVRVAMQETDTGVALLGAAIALRDHVRATKSNRMYFRKPLEDVPDPAPFRRSEP